MNKDSENLIDSSAIILLTEDLSRVLWARRNPALNFMGGYHSFTGGKTTDADYKTTVENCSDSEMSVFITCAVRETFEEAGVLLVRNGDALTKGQIASLHDDLVSGRSRFDEILKQWGLSIDARDFNYAGTWTTPEFLPTRFKTRFFTAVCPSRQIPYDATAELTDFEFIDPLRAVKRWDRSEVLVAPPVLFSLRGLIGANQSGLKSISEILVSQAKTKAKEDVYMELNSRFTCFPLKTATLPPASHTNCFIVGSRRFIVIDAASPDTEEQDKLFSYIDRLIKSGCVCKEIVVSHLHPDHFGGETALKRHLKEKFDLDIPITAHKTTAESLNGLVRFDRCLDDKHTYNLKDQIGNEFVILAFDAPGQARGHLCFYDEELGFLLSSDNVVGVGTVVIAPPEGTMTDYLKTLENLLELPNLNFLCGSHGAAVYDARGKIREYIEHRIQREEQILQLVRQGISEIDEIVENVYTGLDPKLIPLAGKSVDAHLEKLRAENRI